MDLTEPSETPIRAAISLLARPSNTNDSTFRSRSVKYRVPAGCGVVPSVVSRGLQLLLVQPNFPRHHVADSLCQQCSGIMFAKNSRNARADQLRHRSSIHSCGHKENLPIEPLFLGQSEKFSAVTLAKIEVEKHQVNRLSPEDLKSLFDSPTVGNNVESRLDAQEPSLHSPEIARGRLTTKCEAFVPQS